MHDPIRTSWSGVLPVSNNHTSRLLVFLARSTSLCTLTAQGTPSTSHPQNYMSRELSTSFGPHNPYNPGFLTTHALAPGASTHTRTMRPNWVLRSSCKQTCPSRNYPNDPARCRERILIQGFFTPPTSHVTSDLASRSPTYVCNRKLSAYEQSLKRKCWLYEAVCASMVRYA